MQFVTDILVKNIFCDYFHIQALWRMSSTIFMNTNTLLHESGVAIFQNMALISGSENTLQLCVARNLFVETF